MDVCWALVIVVDVSLYVLLVRCERRRFYLRTLLTNSGRCGILLHRGRLASGPERAGYTPTFKLHLEDHFMEAGHTRGSFLWIEWAGRRGSLWYYYRLALDAFGEEMKGPHRLLLSCSKLRKKCKIVARRGFFCDTPSNNIPDHQRNSNARLLLNFILKKFKNQICTHLRFYFLAICASQGWKYGLCYIQGLTNITKEGVSIHICGAPDLVIKQSSLCRP